MAETRYAFVPPRIAVLRWLTDPGSALSPQAGAVLLGELWSSQKAVFAGIANALIVNVAALCMHSGSIFALFIAADLALIMARVAALKRLVGTASQGLPAPSDLYVMTAISWCALQGAIAFTAMLTGNTNLQLLSAVSVTGLIGPICARNYAAPRYAVFLIALSTGPLVAGAALSGNPWLLICLLQGPMLLFAVLKIVGRFHAMAVTTLLAERDSYERARHDALTGLLNRFGLMETLDANYAASPSPFILFYLDLDGFKPINDTFGHQVGDKILQEVAGRLRAAIRSGDVVSRLGGDEFVIVAPGMAPADGAGYAKAIIRQIADEPYLLEATPPLRIGISIGFACAPEDGLAGDDLHRKADAALYEAKAAGKGVQRRFTGLGRQSASPRRVLQAATEEISTRARQNATMPAE